ncbi:putative proteinC DOMAIN-CONTAINING PROTEIN 82-RELATED [Salix viminalis]|uniref:NAC domain-containing protein n=1 Tax=Salix viminalis TaxID=40686 RepID=A0A9Q0SJ56_SALVM|nr:putative proteinC DOMAIN-CONTAINING PROTEIN 82-RELATED [Salix viminalis]
MKERRSVSAMKNLDKQTKWSDPVSALMRHTLCSRKTGAHETSTVVMMESMESCVPPGFRFHPTDEELVGYYLRKKVASQKIDLDVIRDIDLYRIEPWDLQERCRIGYEEQNEWYFFSHKDKKYPTGTRTNRATMAGFWKATGRDKSVYDKTKLIGMRKTLVFYKGRAPNGQKSDWIMHEYRLESDENGRRMGSLSCIQEKSYRAKTRALKDGTRATSTRNQETEGDNLSFMHSENYVQLPQLESPSLPLIKRPSSSISLIPENNNSNREEEEQNRMLSGNSAQKVTDWRALDKFVASQLSQEDRYDGDHGVSSFVGAENNSSDMSLLLLQSGRDEGNNKFNGFLSSSPDCDFGICIFEK